jgi:hypothetical protein
VGTEYFFGTLVFDEAYEILGITENGGNGIEFVGAKMRVATGSTIISDLQSPVVTTDVDEFSDGLVLALSADSSITVQEAIISNLGDDWESQSGDIHLSTEFPGGDILLVSPIVLGEDIFMRSNGNIDIKGQSQIGSYGNIRLESEGLAGYDITVSEKVVFFTSQKLIFINASPNGKVTLKDDVSISAKIIDFCGVAGGPDNITIEPTVDIAGTVWLPGDTECLP